MRVIVSSRCAVQLKNALDLNADDKAERDLRVFFDGQSNFADTRLGSAEELAGILRFVTDTQLNRAWTARLHWTMTLPYFKRVEQAEQFGTIALKVTRSNENSPKSRSMHRY